MGDFNNILWIISTPKLDGTTLKLWTFLITYSCSIIQSFDKSNSQKAACAFKTYQYLESLYTLDCHRIKNITLELNLILWKRHIVQFRVYITKPHSIYTFIVSLHLFPPIPSFISNVSRYIPTKIKVKQSFDPVIYKQHIWK